MGPLLSTSGSRLTGSPHRAIALPIHSASQHEPHTTDYHLYLLFLGPPSHLLAVAIDWAMQRFLVPKATAASSDPPSTTPSPTVVSSAAHTPTSPPASPVSSSPPKRPLEGVDPPFDEPPPKKLKPPPTPTASPPSPSPAFSSPSTSPLSLPAFPAHAAGWSEAAQSFFHTLSPSHRPAFIALIDVILHSPAPRPPPPSLPSTVPSLPSPPPVPLYDPSSVLSTHLQQVFLSPRGRWDVRLTSTSLLLHSDRAGQIPSVLPLSSLTRVLLVPDSNKKDDLMALIFQPPIGLMVGKSVHYHLLIKAERPTTPNPTALYPTLQRRLKSKGGGGEGDGRVEFTEASRGVFTSSTSALYVTCYHGTRDGVLYPLHNGLLFVKPPLWIGVEEVDGVELSRGGGGKTFDLSVGVKGKEGKKEGKETFSMISSEEQSRIEEFVQHLRREQKRREKAGKAGKKEGASAVSDTPGVGREGRDQEMKEQGNGVEGVMDEDDSDSEADSDFAPEDSDDEEEDSEGSGGEDASMSGEGEVSADEGAVDGEGEGTDGEAEGEQERDRAEASSHNNTTSEVLEDREDREGEVTVITSDSETSSSEEEKEGGEAQESGSDSESSGGNDSADVNRVAAAVALPMGQTEDLVDDSDDTDAEDEMANGTVDVVEVE